MILNNISIYDNKDFKIFEFLHIDDLSKENQKTVLKKLQQVEQEGNFNNLGDYDEFKIFNIDDIKKILINNILLLNLISYFIFITFQDELITKKEHIVLLCSSHISLYFKNAELYYQIRAGYQFNFKNKNFNIQNLDTLKQLKNIYHESLDLQQKIIIEFYSLIFEHKTLNMIEKYDFDDISNILEKCREYTSDIYKTFERHKKSLVETFLKNHDEYYSRDQKPYKVRKQILNSCNTYKEEINNTLSAYDEYINQYDENNDDKNEKFNSMYIVSTMEQFENNLNKIRIFIKNIKEELLSKCNIWLNLANKNLTKIHFYKSESILDKNENEVATFMKENQILQKSISSINNFLSEYKEFTRQTNELSKENQSFSSKIQNILAECIKENNENLQQINIFFNEYQLFIENFLEYINNIKKAIKGIRTTNLLIKKNIKGISATNLLIENYNNILFSLAYELPENKSQETQLKGFKICVVNKNLQILKLANEMYKMTIDKKINASNSDKDTTMVINNTNTKTRNSDEKKTIFNFNSDIFHIETIILFGPKNLENKQPVYISLDDLLLMLSEDKKQTITLEKIFNLEYDTLITRPYFLITRETIENNQDFSMAILQKQTRQLFQQINDFNMQNSFIFKEEQKTIKRILSIMATNDNKLKAYGIYPQTKNIESILLKREEN